MKSCFTHFGATMIQYFLNLYSFTFRGRVLGQIGDRCVPDFKWRSDRAATERLTLRKIFFSLWLFWSRKTYNIIIQYKFPDALTILQTSEGRLKWLFFIQLNIYSVFSAKVIWWIKHLLKYFLLLLRVIKLRFIHIFSFHGYLQHRSESL